MIVVSDTSPITNLMRIGRVSLLRDLFEKVIIPAAVYEEVAFLEIQKREIQTIDWISVVTIKNPIYFDDFRLLLTEAKPKPSLFRWS